jgi:hypothetical protein
MVLAPADLAPITNEIYQRWCSVRRHGRSATLRQECVFPVLSWTDRAWILDGQRVRMGWRRSPTTPGSHPSGGTLSRRRNPRVCLGIDIPPKTPLDDIESKRGEDGYGRRLLSLLLLEQESKGIKDRLIWFDCWCAQSTVPLHIYIYRGLDPFLSFHQHNPQV